MKLKNLIITLGLSLTVGAGVAVGIGSTQNQQKRGVEAATPTTVYYPVSTTYTVKCNVNRQGDADNWAQYTMTKTSDTYFGTPIYSVTFTDVYDGLGRLQFQQYDGSKWISQVEAISSWTSVSEYNGKLYDSGWKSYRNDVYSLIGTFGGHDWNYDEDMSYNNSTKIATLSSFTMSKGDAFKIRSGHKWDTEFAWSNVNSQTITDPQSRGENCFGDGGSGNIAVLHDGTYTFSLNATTGKIDITGTRAINDSDVNFEIYIDSGSGYVATTMELQTASTTEFKITRDFAAGEKFYFKYGSYYYHYSDVKEACTLKGTQFIADGNDTLVLYHGNYTIYFETASGDNFGGWLQYNSVSSAQIRSNVISFAQYFNEQVGGACDITGEDTDIEDLQTAWQNTQTRYANAPDSSVKSAIAAVTTSDANAGVAEFAGKYDKVYYLRGNSLGSSGGEYLSRGITPRQAMRTNVLDSESNGLATTLVIIASIGLLTACAYYFFKKTKKVEG